MDQNSPSEVKSNGIRANGSENGIKTPFLIGVAGGTASGKVGLELSHIGKKIWITEAVHSMCCLLLRISRKVALKNGCPFCDQNITELRGSTIDTVVWSKCIADIYVRVFFLVDRV